MLRSTTALAGARRWDVTATTSVLDVSANRYKGWVDPILGARFRTDLGQALSLEAMANIGGFGVGSDFQREIIAQIEYRTTDRFSVSGGYRFLDVEFDSGLVESLQLNGPFVALSFNF